MGYSSYPKNEGCGFPWNIHNILIEMKDAFLFIATSNTTSCISGLGICWLCLNMPKPVGTAAASCVREKMILMRGSNFFGQGPISSMYIYQKMYYHVFGCIW